MKKILLQLAMDKAAERSLEEALDILRETAEYVDIIEVGTSFVLRYGMAAVTQFKNHFPEKMILADMKIMDGGYHHCAMGCKAGADIVTVLGAADRDTIKKASLAAHDNGSQVMVDLINVKDLEAMTAFCEESNVDFICVHAGVDMQARGKDPYDELKRVSGLAKNCLVAVAGGISEDTMEDLCHLGPDIIIVGNGICGQQNPRQAASQIRRNIDKFCEVM